LKRIVALLTAILVVVSLPKSVRAFYDPLSVPNNKFGIHIQSENDLDNAKNLVNSSGGDWGYVTLVITKNDRDNTRWQRIFDGMRRKHLIPIVRIATEVKDKNWQIPEAEDIDNWVSFLDSLNWVIENRYVVIANEPNHAKEWGGELDAASYASYLKNFSQKLKAKSPDFFVLPAGLDPSSPNSVDTMDEARFISLMLKAEPEVFNYVDGWTSHSYPNPSFSGSAAAKGKGTITSYIWELAYLKSLGISKELPVFITETGWSNKDLTEEEIGERFFFAFKNVWSDERIAAVTPFILNYTDEPFKEFSWQKEDGSFHSFYDNVSGLLKIKGEPVQTVKGKILAAFVNPFLIASSSFKGVVLAQNLGQSIWVTPEIEVNDQSYKVNLTTADFGELAPNEAKLLYFTGRTPDIAGRFDTKIVINHKKQPVSDIHSLELNVIKPAEVKKTDPFAKIQMWLTEVVRFFQGL
jgi:hypothetical protein